MELSFNGIECEKLNKGILDHFENKIDDYLRDLDKAEYQDASIRMSCFYKEKK